MINDLIYVLAFHKAAADNGHAGTGALLGGVAGGALGAVGGALYVGHAARKVVEQKRKMFERMSMLQKLKYIMKKKGEAKEEKKELSTAPFHHSLKSLWVGLGAVALPALGYAVGKSRGERQALDTLLSSTANLNKLRRLHYLKSEGIA